MRAVAARKTQAISEKMEQQKLLKKTRHDSDRNEDHSDTGDHCAVIMWTRSPACSPQTAGHIHWQHTSGPAVLSCMDYRRILRLSAVEYQDGKGRWEWGRGGRVKRVKSHLETNAMFPACCSLVF